MNDALIRSVQLEVMERVVDVHEGGDGPPILLIHGGWGGATAWSRVWNALAERHRIVAPDLPGLGAVATAALPSVAGYAAWLAALLDALGIAKATFVGNSFGASVAWSLAGRFPERCTGLVMVDGIPMPRTPLPMLWIGHTSMGRALMRWGVRRFSYSPRMLERAFVNPSSAPRDIRAMLRDEHNPVVARFSAIVIEGDGPPEPKVEPLLIWGACDRLMGTRLSDARRLHARLPTSELRIIPDAGHFPQLEAPERFVDELERWWAVRGGGGCMT